MTDPSAHDVAAEIRRQLPGVPVKKLHKLLYYCQGHHLAAFARPLFAERISAWDMGPVVGQLWWAEQQPTPGRSGADPALGEAELNTVGYVVGRYGRLSGLDLERLTHSEPPWSNADAERRAQGINSIEIPLSALGDFFSADDRDAESSDEPAPDPHVIETWLKAALAQHRSEGSPDTLESVLARL
ncbi:MAG: Panacea domain-containing protein [Jatrophihabitantaceae bacterium]